MSGGPWEKLRRWEPGKFRRSIEGLVPTKAGILRIRVSFDGVEHAYDGSKIIMAPLSARQFKIENSKFKILHLPGRPDTPSHLSVIP